MEHSQEEHQNLIEELENFQKEKERVRNLIGKIGGKNTALKDKIINIVFIVAITILFVSDLLHHVFKINVPIPSILSLELAVLLVSVKIIWMIHKSSKVEHFQFWILNSIEFRLSDMSKKINAIEKEINKNKKA